MKLKELNHQEQIDVYGGSDRSSYNLGYKIGYWIGSGAATIRNVTYLVEDTVKDALDYIEKIR